MNKTSIPWADLTWNPITGCTKGCPYCYARKIACRFGPDMYPGCGDEEANDYFARNGAFEGSKYPSFPVGFFPTVYPYRLDEPLRLRKPSRIFLGSMGDLFDPAFPDEFRDEIMATVGAEQRHTFILLTKQPENMRRYFEQRLRNGWGWAPDSDLGSMPPNLWLGVTVTNQADADERIPLLLDTPAAVRFVSVEPMLGSISFRWATWDDDTPHDRRAGKPGQSCPGRFTTDGKPLAAQVNHLDGLRMLDWVVVGGKTPGKPLHERVYQSQEWAMSPADSVRSLRDQCAEAGVPFFYKHGGTTPALDGVVYDQYPGVPR